MWGVAMWGVAMWGVAMWGVEDVGSGDVGCGDVGSGDVGSGDVGVTMWGVTIRGVATHRPLLHCLQFGLFHFPRRQRQRVAACVRPSARLAVIRARPPFGHHPLLHLDL